MQQIHTLLHKAGEQPAGMHSSEWRHACHALEGSRGVVAGTAVIVSPPLRRLFGVASGMYRNTCGWPNQSIWLSAVYPESWQSHAPATQKAFLDTHSRSPRPMYQLVHLYQRGFQAHS